MTTPNAEDPSPWYLGSVTTPISTSTNPHSPHSPQHSSFTVASTASTEIPNLPVRSRRRTPTDGDHHLSLEMASPPEHDQEHSTTDQAVGSLTGENPGLENAPRTRSSTFGLQYGSLDVPETPTSGGQEPLLAQHSGPLNAHRLTTQAGPQYSRNVSASPPGSTSSGPYDPSFATGRPTAPTKSPFTSPIACPPRTRPNQILLINPACTSALTTILLNTLRPILPNALEVTAYTAPYPSPTAIESVVDAVLSSEATLRDLARYSTNNGETVQNFDGLLVASYCKHPLIDALRESYDVPVIGIMEASLYVARMLGGRFGIVTTSTRVKNQVEDAVAAYGLGQYCVGTESLHVNPLDLTELGFVAGTASSDRASQPSMASTGKARNELTKRLAVQARILVSKGADTIVLGSEFLTNNDAIRAVKDAVRDDDGRRTVNVIDAVEAGIMMLNGLVGMGIPTSKKGIYRGEREGRRGRGQNWL